MTKSKRRRRSSATKGTTSISVYRQCVGWVAIFRHYSDGKIYMTNAEGRTKRAALRNLEKRLGH